LSDLIHVFHLAESATWVDSARYPEAGGCNLLCLSDRQVATVRQLLRCGTWPTRFARNLSGSTFTYGDPAVYLEHKTEVEELLDQLGGCDMGCNSLILALGDLASAMAAATGAGTPTVVNCGSGGGGGGSPVQIALSCVDIPIESLVPAVDVVEPSPSGDPPDGFETWEEYRIYKCKAAHFITNAIISGFRGYARVDLVNAMIGGLSIWLGVALGPLAELTSWPILTSMMTMLAQMEALTSGGNILYLQLADYVNERKQEIICALYLSSSAADAVMVFTSIIDDALEALVFGPEFEAVAGTLGPLLTTGATQLANLGVMRALFEVTADVMWPNADCSDCEEEVDLGPPWHFTDGLQGWVWTPAEVNDQTVTVVGDRVVADPADVTDESEECLHVSIDTPGSKDAGGVWERNVEDLDITAAEGWHWACKFRVSRTPGINTTFFIRFANEASTTTGMTNDDHTSWTSQSCYVNSNNYNQKVVTIGLWVMASYSTSGLRELWMDNISLSS